MSYAPRQQRSLALRLLPVLVGLLAVGLYYYTHSQEGPGGRRQVVALNEGQESQLGLQAFQQVLRESSVVQSGPAAEVVNRLTKQLVAAAESPEFLAQFKLPKRDYQWDARVIRSRDANAFCLPGGKMVVYTGLFPVAETESALAAVMGHEIAHALARHGSERMAQEQMIQMGTQAVAGAFTDLNVDQQRALMAALGTGARYGIALPFSRSHESEADHIGLVLMAAAGHDPRQAIVLWQNMAKSSKGQPSEFLSTHPSHETRIRDIEGWLDEANVFYRRASARQPDKPLPIEGAERLPGAGLRGPEGDGKLDAPPGRTAPARGIPTKVLQVLKFIDQHDEAPAGYEGGRNFGNFEKHLPSRDKDGKSIKYREWDVNPLRPGVNRGAERLVTGSDGSAYYTTDHYESFRRIR